MRSRVKRSAAAFAAGAAALAIATTASARDYVSVSGAFSLLKNSDNLGVLTGPFTTGQGTTIPGGTILPAGTLVGWNTDFNRGFAFSGAYGKRFGGFDAAGLGGLRAELEVAFQRNRVNRHRNVVAGALPLGGEDAGIFVPGSGPTGITVSNFVANDDGRNRTLFLMANALYDIDVGWGVRPYLGAGLGVGFVSVRYEPVGMTFIEDSSAKFAWQAMGGASFAIGLNTDLYAGYRFRKTKDPRVSATFLPADFTVQNRGSLIEAGLRFSF